MSDTKPTAPQYLCDASELELTRRQNTKLIEDVEWLQTELMATRTLHAAALTIIAMRMMPCPTGEPDDVFDCTPFMERAEGLVERRAKEIRHLMTRKTAIDGKVMNLWMREQAGGAS